MKILHADGVGVKKNEEPMTTTQLSLTFDIPHFDTLKEAVEFAITTSGRSRKYIAADLGMTEGQLSMMLSEYEGRNFPLFRFPDLVRSLGERGKIPVQWLAVEFLSAPEDQIARAAATLLEFSKALPAITKAAETITRAKEVKKK